MSYKFLPFRFLRFDNNDYFLSNEVGEFLFLSNQDFKDFINHQLSEKSNTFLNLKSKQMLTNTELEPVIEMLSTKYRTKKHFLDNFTILHMVVPTLRCNSNCVYCQVSSKDLNANFLDMPKSTARKIVDMIFQSPSPQIKIEFQGGEPLLNFKIIKYIMEYAEWKNVFKRKALDFVICTNLTLIDENILKYLKNHHVYISTSLDGPEALHNKNRPLKTSNNYKILVEKIALCRKYLGNDSVSALMTTSKYNINNFIDIINEYIKLGFNSIFLRSLNPFGRAKCDNHIIGYKIEDFIDCYKDALNYILEINLKGTYFSESFATLLLNRILTPFSTGFVDLQSPAGTAICCAIYNYDGNVYVSDEARMLASTGDQKFLMGNVLKNTYQDIFNSTFVRSIINSACVECLPGCFDCAYQCFCGADPVRNYSEQNDIIGNRTKSEVCKKNKAIIHYILELVKINDKNINKVFWSWMNRCSFEND